MFSKISLFVPCMLGLTEAVQLGAEAEQGASTPTGRGFQFLSKDVSSEVKQYAILDFSTSLEYRSTKGRIIAVMESTKTTGTVVRYKATRMPTDIEVSKISIDIVVNRRSDDYPGKFNSDTCKFEYTNDDPEDFTERRFTTPIGIV